MKNKTTIRTVSHHSKSHTQQNSGEIITKGKDSESGSTFDNFAKNFFDIFTEKDHIESRKYFEMKSIDANKNHKLL